MLIQLKKTTITYFCPRCTFAVVSQAGIFSLSGDMFRLKCTCEGSKNDDGLVVSYTADKKIRLSVPCIICPKPHNFVVGADVFFERELFVVNCTYTGLDLAFVGDESASRAAASAAGDNMREIISQNDKTDVLEELEEFEEHEDFEDSSLVGPVEDIVRFMLGELQADEKIDCRCGESGTTPQIDFRLRADSAQVYCDTCKAEVKLPLASIGDAELFINIDELTLV